MLVVVTPLSSVAWQGRRGALHLVSVSGQRRVMFERVGESDQPRVVPRPSHELDVDRLHKATGRVEASFASKLVAIKMLDLVLWQTREQHDAPLRLW